VFGSCGGFARRSQRRREIAGFGVNDDSFRQRAAISSMQRSDADVTVTQSLFLFDYELKCHRLRATSSFIGY
jgi:hypothetical protein